MADQNIEILLEGSLSLLSIEGESENHPPKFTVVTSVEYQKFDDVPEESRLFLHGVGKMFTTSQVSVDEKAKTVRFKAFGDDYIVSPIAEEDWEEMYPELREELKELEREVNQNGE